MTKQPIRLSADDMTVFCRTLAKQLGDNSPSHLALMNMVARAAGFQNLQHMRAGAAADRRLSRSQAEASDAILAARSVERALNLFDGQGRLQQWPSRRAVQTLALWGLWAVLPSQKLLSEKAVNAHLATEHTFGDAATLRRTMISCGLLTRNRDGSDYCRVEQKPPAEAQAVIRDLKARRCARGQQ